MCGFAEAALEHGLLSRSQLDTLGPDLEASLPVLRACRQVLVVIPASRENHPRIVDLLRDQETLRRLRHIHGAFGDALHEERASRELDFLDASGGIMTSAALQQLATADTLADAQVRTAEGHARRSSARSQR